MLPLNSGHFGACPKPKRLLVPPPQVGKAKPVNGASKHLPTSWPEIAAFHKVATGVLSSMLEKNKIEGKGNDKNFRGKANDEYKNIE